MLNRFAQVAAFFILFTAPSVFAEDLSPPPWHLVDIWYRLETDIEFQSLSIDVEIIGDVEEDVALYIAPFGLGVINGIEFYGGIQNYDNVIVPATGEKLDITRIGIFSRWKERDLKFTRIEPDGWSESSDHEDDFIGVRAPLNWKPGKYRFTLSVIEAPRGRSNKNTWVEMSVQSLRNGIIKRIGALCFPGNPPELSRSFCSFIEIFKPISRSRYPRLTVIFSNFQVNGGPWETEEITAIYPNDVPQIAHTSGTAQKITVQLGDEARGRENGEDDIQKSRLNSKTPLGFSAGRLLITN